MNKLLQPNMLASHKLAKCLHILSLKEKITLSEEFEIELREVYTGTRNNIESNLRTGNYNYEYSEHASFYFLLDQGKKCINRRLTGIIGGEQRLEDPNETYIQCLSETIFLLLQEQKFDQSIIEYSKREILQLGIVQFNWKKMHTLVSNTIDSASISSEKHVEKTLILQFIALLDRLTSK